jgi:hypothetical protein
MFRVRQEHAWGTFGAHMGSVWGRFNVTIKSLILFSRSRTFAPAVIPLHHLPPPQRLNTSQHRSHTMTTTGTTHHNTAVTRSQRTTLSRQSSRGTTSIY